jgi:type I restriction enzyme, S subunit
MSVGPRPYPNYKESGTQWLGQVPDHWDVAAVIAAYRPRLVRNTGMAEKTVLSLSYGRIVVKPPERLHGLVPESFETYQIVNPGNIIIRTTDLQNDHTSLRVGHAKERGIITSAYMCLETTSRVSNDFGYQFLNAYDLLKIIYGYGSGLRQNLDFVHIKRMPVLIPPLPEQSAIVRFLDYADRMISSYIRAKQKLIKLLEEQKQAIIHEAVTGQIDVRFGKPYPAYKDSGVQWFGKVPKHWDVAPLYAIARSKSVTGRQDRELLSVYLDRGVIRFSEVEEKRTNTTSEDLSKYQAVDPGDFVLNNQQAWRGSVGVSSHAGIVSPAYLVLSLDSQFQPEYANLLLRDRVMVSQYLICSKGVGSIQRNLYWPHLKRISTLLPPAEEQASIVKYTHEVTGDVDFAMARTNREIALLSEYRTRLIADVVTGKLDVREAAANLPEDADEPEPLRNEGLLAEAGEASEVAELEPAFEGTEV